MVEWFEQPDPLIDDYLALLRRWDLSAVEVRTRELRVKLFEVRMLDKGLSMYETTPHHVRCHLYGLTARSATIVCLRQHWFVLREYFDFMVWKGCFLKNPVTAETWPAYGCERTCRDKNKIRDPLKGMKGASYRMRAPIKKGR